MLALAFDPAQSPAAAAGAVAAIAVCSLVAAIILRLSALWIARAKVGFGVALIIGAASVLCITGFNIASPSHHTEPGDAPVMLLASFALVAILATALIHAPDSKKTISLGKAALVSLVFHGIEIGLGIIIGFTLNYVVHIL